MNVPSMMDRMVLFLTASRISLAAIANVIRKEVLKPASTWTTVVLASVIMVHLL
jgi:hypothetical protein